MLGVSIPGSFTLWAANNAKLTIRSTRGLRLTFRASITQRKLRLSVILCLIPNQTQNTSNDVAHHHLSGLRSHQTPSHGLHPLDQFDGICSPTSRDDAKKKVSRGRCA